MQTVGEIKRFILRCLARVGGLPMREAQLVDAICQGMTPRPLRSDINEAIRELESAGFTVGNHDELDASIVTWTLTDRGTHKARTLG